MFTFLDLLVIVFMALIALSLLALCLMFLTIKPRLKKVCFFIVVALGIYACSISLRIGWGFFPVQVIMGLCMGALSIVALVLGLISKGDKMKFRIATILAAVALVIGVINAIL